MSRTPRQHAPGALRVLAASPAVDSSIAHIRLIDPLRAVIEQRGGQLRVLPSELIGRRDLAWADVLVIQRPTNNRDLQTIQRMQLRGGAVVLDIDDLLTEPAPHLKDHADLTRLKPWVLRCLQTANLVTVSTTLLGNMLRLPLERRHTVPNSAAVQSHGALPSQDPSQPVTLVLASSDRVAVGAPLQAVRALLERHSAGVKVVGVGYIIESLNIAGIEAEHYPLLSRPDFVELVRQQINPVAVMPLDDSRFSAGKSAIKWFDYAAIGVPTLAAKLSPYREVMTDGVTGALVGPHYDDWAAALERAVTDPAWRERVTQAARAEVQRRHSFPNTVQAWSEALERVRAIATQQQQQQRWPSLTQRAWAACLAWGGDAVVSLRRVNRRRLERRRALKAVR